MKNASIRSTLQTTMMVHCVALSVLISIGAYFLLGLEREYWTEKQLIEFQNITSQQLNSEFEFLVASTKQIGKEIESSVSEHQNPLDVIPSIMTPELLKETLMTSAFVQDGAGRFITTSTFLEPQIEEHLEELHQSINGMNLGLQTDFGFDYVNGRIFAYAKTIHTVNQKAFFVIGLRELSPKFLREFSKRMGKRMKLNYLYPGLRVTQVSHRDGIVVNLVSVENSDEGTVAEFMIEAAYNSPKPVSFKIHLPKDSEVVTTTRILLIFLIFLVPVSSMIVWYVINIKILKPGHSLLKQLSNTETLIADTKKPNAYGRYPIEYQNIYTAFKSVYSSMQNRNHFNELLVDAIGDIIITVNREGVIDYANPAAEHWMQASTSQLIGKPLNLLIANIDSEAPDVNNWLHRANKDKKRTETSAIIASLLVGDTIFTADVICQPLDWNEEDGTATAVIVVRVKDVQSAKDFK